MKATLDFNFSELKAFERKCEVIAKNVETGTKKATTAACQEILGISMAQVPKATNTLLNSAFYEVTRRTDVKQGFQGVIGYGGNGDPVNPKTGRSASSYMVAVHENLGAKHPTGKAKFLEDPMREFAEERFVLAIIESVRAALK